LRQRSKSNVSSRSESSRKNKRRRKDKLFHEDKTNKRRKEKPRDVREVEKAPEPKEIKDKDKEKKRKKKRREKSISPVKAIVADGDSIVVSLNFQKGKDTGSSASSTVKENGDIGRKNVSESDKKGSRNSKNRTSSSISEDKTNDSTTVIKPKSLKKTVLIDLEASPIQEQCIGASPTLIVLSDDEEDTVSKGKLSKSKTPSEEKEKETGLASAISSSENKKDSSPQFSHKTTHSILPELSDMQTQRQSDHSTTGQDDSSANISSHSRGMSLSPTEFIGKSPPAGDFLSKEETADTSMQEKESSFARSPVDSSVDSSKKDPLRTASPADSTPPLPPGTPPPDAPSEPIPLPPSTLPFHVHNGHPMMTPVVTPVPPPVTKPLIGNIPGLFPSGVGGNISVPPPIVIPTPPQPSQLRFTPSGAPNILNPSVLASVASVLYGPVLAARQQQQQSALLSKSIQMAANNFGKNNVGSSMQRSQNPFNSQGGTNRSNNNGQLYGDCDSPMSPNSSDGDDLFEPPTDKSHDSNCSGSSKDKALGSNPSSGVTNAGGPKPRDKASLFDNLFGTPTKKHGPHDRQNKTTKGKPGAPHKLKKKSELYSFVFL